MIRKVARVVVGAMGGANLPGPVRKAQVILIALSLSLSLFPGGERRWKGVD